MADRAIPEESDIRQENDFLIYNERQQGVFAANPLSTPKYAINDGKRDAEFKETLARMYISLADANTATRDAYLASLPNDLRVQALAKVLTGTNEKGASGFIDFFLQEATESFAEKLQVDEVLSDNYVAFYFGQEPPVFQYSGTLLNTKQDDQTTGFALAYQHLLRGTSMAKRGTLLRLRYDNRIITGTVNRMQTSLRAENELAVLFSFSLLVKEYVLLKQIDYVKIDEDEFVQLATAFDNGEGILANDVGETKKPRTRTSVLYGAGLSNTSVAGSDKDKPDTNPTQAAPQQNQQAVQQATQPSSGTGDIRGTPPSEPLQSVPGVEDQAAQQSVPG